MNSRQIFKLQLLPHSMDDVRSPMFGYIMLLAAVFVPMFFAINRSLISSLKPRFNNKFVIKSLIPVLNCRKEVNISTKRKLYTGPFLVFTWRSRLTFIVILTHMPSLYCYLRHESRILKRFPRTQQIFFSPLRRINIEILVSPSGSAPISTSFPPVPLPPGESGIFWPQ